MILMTFLLLILQRQQFFKEIYEDFLKYGTVGEDIRNVHMKKILVKITLL